MRPLPRRTPVYSGRGTQPALPFQNSSPLSTAPLPSVSKSRSFSSS